MRILLAGPLPHGNKNGGVAVFDKNIARELYNHGYSLRVISSFNGNIDSKIKVFSFYHTLNILRKFRPTTIISSLAFSVLFLFLDKKRIKIHLLHGFTNFKNYNFVKVCLMHLLDCFIRKRFKYVLANSKFTGFINDEIFNIKPDGFFRIGLNNTYINKLKYMSLNHKHNSVLYVGRMVNAKNVKLIYKAFCRIRNDKCKLNFIGYGPESSWIINRTKNKNNISFLGFKRNRNIFKYYRESKVFISLNPSEPYGITYVEALLNNDFIVAPDTGGQVDLLKQFPERCKLVDLNDMNTIVSAIKIGLNKKLVPFRNKYNIDNFNYNRTLQDLRVFMN